jgi:hypothetical protein
MKHEPHIERVVAEHAELAERHKKLTAFYDSPIFAKLPADEQADMREQGKHMGAYASVLHSRLKRAGVHDTTPIKRVPVQTLDDEPTLDSGGNSPAPPTPPSH